MTKCMTFAVGIIGIAGSMRSIHAVRMGREIGANAMTKRAMRFHDRYTKAELIAMQQSLFSDPRYANEERSLFRLNSQGRRLHEDIGWAIYWHNAPRGNEKQAVAPVQRKWW